MHDKHLYDRAIADYDEAVIRLNEDATAYNRGNAYAAKHLYDRAIADYDEAILSTRYATAFTNRGRAYETSTCTTTAPSPTTARRSASTVCDRLLQSRQRLSKQAPIHDRAIADFDRAIRLNPEYATAFNNRGIAYQNNYFDRAIADYDEAIRINPEYATAFTNRGNAWR